ncbi:hypothetical protein STEG23_031483, partial [Scotinomys teguina]
MEKEPEKEEDSRHQPPSYTVSHGSKSKIYRREQEKPSNKRYDVGDFPVTLIISECFTEHQLSPLPTHCQQSEDTGGLPCLSPQHPPQGLSLPFVPPTPPLYHDALGFTSDRIKGIHTLRPLKPLSRRPEFSSQHSHNGSQPLLPDSGHNATHIPTPNASLAVMDCIHTPTPNASLAVMDCIHTPTPNASLAVMDCIHTPTPNASLAVMDCIHTPTPNASLAVMDCIHTPTPNASLAVMDCIHTPTPNASLAVMDCIHTPTPNASLAVMDCIHTPTPNASLAVMD